MPSADVHGLVKRFQALAVRRALKEDVSADLVQLVKLVDASVTAQAPAAWVENAKRVRGQLKALLGSLELVEPGLPNKLTSPENRAQREFYHEAIAHLDTLIEGHA